MWIRLNWFALLIFTMTSGALGADLSVKVLYLEHQALRPPTLSNLDPVPEDEGLAGARLGLADNATTGRFLGHAYALEEVIVAPEADFLAEAEDAVARADLLLVSAGRESLLALADKLRGEDKLIFNVASPDDSLRAEACRANVLHTLPSRAMLTDALGQFALRKRWKSWALIAGPEAGDQAFAKALEKSARKFGLSIAGRKDWDKLGDIRRSAAQEVPLFTKAFDDHDLLMLADEANDFARYVNYNSWLPRPLGGSIGLVPSAWHRAMEQFGAAQLQSRFEALAGREMRPLDYAAWAAMRALGEAAVRTESAEASEISRYLLSENFELGGFKGQKLSFRAWNGQLRQPIPLAYHDAVVAIAPFEGFLHPSNVLDTLGLDQAETPCNQF